MPVTFKKQTLPNGLTVIAEVDPGAHSAACGFFVKTGARDEERPVMGVSHFLEHMMFKGTGELSAHEINRRFDDLGARNNAFTSTELTCFYATVLPEHLHDAADLLGRMMRPALRQEDFDTEKGVILEEIAMYKDNPFWVLYEECVERHFGDHPLGHRVLGTERTITDLTRDQMKAYFDQRYSADNTTIALAGRLDFERAVGTIEKSCGSWRPTGARRNYAPAEAVGSAFELRDQKVSRAYIFGLCDGPPMEDDRRYAAALLAQVLGAPDNSRLHWALIETGLAEEAVATYDAHDGQGQYYIYASGDPARTEAIWDAIGVQLDGLIESLTEDDLVRLRNKHLTGSTLSAERPTDRMHRLGRLWTYLSSYRPLEEDLARIGAVTLDEIRRVYEAFPLRPRTVGRLLPPA